ncbi:MAG: hypothetical protein BRC58_11050 [Cyanobacteria bacterium QS_8_64_29]|nr:MAG: hypothetical protein BRC58_11050 [Cyanobacteria bacterium QS_8_64_29]
MRALGHSPASRPKRCSSKASPKLSRGIRDFNRGIARTLRGNYDAAVRDYDRAIELDPDNASAYFNRANARTQLGNLQGALSDFDAALRQNPEFAAALANRGVARAALVLQSRFGVGRSSSVVTASRDGLVMATPVRPKQRLLGTLQLGQHDGQQ